MKRTNEVIVAEIAELKEEIRALREEQRELKKEQSKESGYSKMLADRKELRRLALMRFLSGDSASKAWREVSGCTANASNVIKKAWRENYPEHHYRHQEMEWARLNALPLADRYNDNYSMSLDYLRDHPPLQVAKR